MKLNTAYSRLDKLADSFTPETIASTVAAVAFFALEHNQVKIGKLNVLRGVGVDNSSIRSLMQLVVKFTPVEWSKKQESYSFSHDKRTKILDMLELPELTLEGVEQAIYKSITDKPDTAPKFTPLTEKWSVQRIAKFNELATVDQKLKEIDQVKAYLQAIERELSSSTQGTPLSSVADALEHASH